MDKALNALYGAGYQAPGYDLIELKACVPTDQSCAMYPIVSHENGGIGISDPAYIGRRETTRCNSPSHLISYLRRPDRA